MLKNVTIRGGANNIEQHVETFPSKESEQKAALKPYGPGKYKISWHGTQWSEEKGRNVNAIKNKVIYVGDAFSGQSARQGNYGLMPNLGGIDLSLYRELLGPFVTRIAEHLERIEEKQTEILDLLAIEEGEPDTDGGDNANPLAGMEGEAGKAARIAQALEELQKGVPIPELMTKYADLIPDIMKMVSESGIMPK